MRVTGGEEDLGADGLTLASGPNDALPIASITKLITALVVLDARPLADADDSGPSITFTEADEDLYDFYYVKGATIASMPAGTTVSQRDALATMLIPSASNYAAMLSRWAYGSEGAFLDAARAWLDANGLTSTTIVDPAGIDRRNVSTPSDLIALARLAAADPVVGVLAGWSGVTPRGDRRRARRRQSRMDGCRRGAGAAYGEKRIPRSASRDRGRTARRVHDAVGRNP